MTSTAASFAFSPAKTGKTSIQTTARRLQLELPTESQNRIILNHLRRFGKITSIEAITLYRITRLSGRIYDLIQAGEKIEAKIVFDPDDRRRHWSQYTIAK